MAEKVKIVIDSIESFSQSKGGQRCRFIEFILVLENWDLSLKCP